MTDDPLTALDELTEEITADIAPTRRCRLCAADTDLDSSEDRCLDASTCFERFERTCDTLEGTAK